MLWKHVIFSILHALDKFLLDRTITYKCFVILWHIKLLCLLSLIFIQDTSRLLYFLKVFLWFNMCKHQIWLCKVLLALDTDHCFFLIIAYWMFLNCPSLLSTAGDQNYFIFKVFNFKMCQTCGLLVSDCDLQGFGAYLEAI